MKVGFVVYTEYEMNRNEFFIEKLLTVAYKFSIKLIPVIFEFTWGVSIFIFICGVSTIWDFGFVPWIIPVE